MNHRPWRAWWPRSLMGRLIWIIGGSLAITHALTVLIILRERGDQGMRMMLAYVGRDVATSMAILDRIPPCGTPRLAAPPGPTELRLPDG